MPPKDKDVEVTTWIDKDGSWNVEIEPVREVEYTVRDNDGNEDRRTGRVEWDDDA